jgi:hypothetical protein
MQRMNDTFLLFLESLMDKKNSFLLESIQLGYMICFEALKVSKLPKPKVRKLTEEEARREYKKRQGKLPLEFLVNRAFAVVDEVTNDILAIAPDEYVANNIKERMNSIIKEQTMEKEIPEMPLPSPVQHDEYEEKVPSEIKSSTPAEKAKFFEWLNRYNYYMQIMERIDNYLKELKRKNPHIY